MQSNLENEARIVLNKYLEKATAYKLSKLTGVKQPTITRFAREETSMQFRTWDRLYPEIVKELND